LKKAIDMPTKVLHSSRPKVSATDFSRNEIIAFLNKKLAKHDIEKAFIFGSVANGECGNWSDIDVIIVKQTDVAFIERGAEFFDLFDLGIPVDILVYTPQEFHLLMQDPSPFWRKIQNSMIQIY
jgi:predicted nucleotidyltransferase